MQIERVAYLLFMLIALAVFVALRLWQSKRFSLTSGLSAWDSWKLALAAFIGGALGAKLPFIVGQTWSWLSGTVWLSDGKTITTGMAGAYLTVELAKRAFGIQAKTGDSFALPLAGALAVGRWGCFFNGCCYGLPTALPWGVEFAENGVCHPTQIYESLFHLSLAGLLIWMIATQRLRYQKLKFYLISYCVYRFVTEWIRPEPKLIGELTFYQCFVVVFALLLAVQWWYDQRLQMQSIATGTTQA